MARDVRVPIVLLAGLHEDLLAMYAITLLAAGFHRSRVNFFMKRFRKLGFIEYNGDLKIHDSLMSVVLHE